MQPLKIYDTVDLFDKIHKILTKYKCFVKNMLLLENTQGAPLGHTGLVKYTNYTLQTQLLTPVIILSVSVSFRMYRNPILCMLEYPKPWDIMVKSLEIQLWIPNILDFFLVSIVGTLTFYPRVSKTPEMNVSRRVRKPRYQKLCLTPNSREDIDVSVFEFFFYFFTNVKIHRILVRT